ncbi:histidine kinase [Burkholderiaceae bacterium 16]|nr:histidine kinase [Burkholderiaceae bacterium 16]
MSTSKEIRILLLEDSISDAFLIEMALADVVEFEHRLVRAERLSDGLARAQSMPFDVVLLDLGLPDAQKLDTVRTFIRLSPGVPVLVLTGLDDASVGLLAIQEGAQDYLLKRDIHPSELGRTIRYAIERHHIAAALRASEERFQLAVAGATAGLWDWNLQTGAMYISPYFKKIMGYEDSELPNEARVLRDAIHPEDTDRVSASLIAHLEHKCVYDEEYRVQTKSRDFRWVQSRGQALWNDSDQPYRMVGWIMDITDRKRADDALRESREELQRLSANIQHVREEEKNHIARELHDDLGQQLATLKVEAAKIEDPLIAAETPAPVANLHRVYLLIDQIIGSVRRIAAGLRPTMLDDLGLVPAVNWLIDEFSASHDVQVVRRIDANDIAFNHEGGTAVFRIVQEALTNVARHSGATSVTLEIVRNETNCIVRVIDNGRGSPNDAHANANAFGLLGMRERAARLGGSIRIKTAPNQGFALTVVLPLATIEASEH